MDLINRIAAKLGTKKVIFASNCTKLTIDMLSNVALGKGAHLSMEMVKAFKIFKKIRNENKLGSI